MLYVRRARLLGFFLLVSTQSGFAAPYPQSELFSGAEFDQSTLVRKASGSDNWASTWAQDNNIYTTWGDGNGFGNVDRGMGVAKLSGGPEAFSGQNLWGVERGYFGGKSLGILAVGDSLFMLAGPGAGPEAFSETWLQWSNDLGKTWLLSYPELFFRAADGFSKPTFLNFGRGYDGARDSYVYIYGIDYSDGRPITNLNLARVPVDKVRNRRAYEFFASGDGTNPSWSPNVANREPVFRDTEGGIGDSPSVIYNRVLDRYFMCKTHDTDTPDKPHGGLGIFEAPAPWGPWKTVVYIDDWLNSGNMYFCQFPTKWIAQDGLEMWMVFTGYGSDPVARDAYQHIRLRLLPKDNDTPRAPILQDPDITD